MKSKYFQIFGKENIPRIFLNLYDDTFVLNLDVDLWQLITLLIEQLWGTTRWITTQLSSSFQEPETFPCDNFICLLQNFELMKTNNGYLVRKLQKSESSENCVHFKCWLNKFRLTKTKFGFEFIDKKLQNLPTFSNDNDFSIFQSHTEDSSTYDQVVFPRSSTHQENMETSTVIPTLTEHSDLSEAALDDFFENYDYEEYDEWYLFWKKKHAKKYKFF